MSLPALRSLEAMAYSVKDFLRLSRPLGARPLNLLLNTVQSLPTCPPPSPSYSLSSRNLPHPVPLIFDRFAGRQQMPLLGKSGRATGKPE